MIEGQKKMYIIKTLAILAMLPLASYAALKPEADYQEDICKGVKEVRLSDNTRADCVTETYAIEIDFAHKWAEAIGQSLHYARLLNKKAMILLIVEDANDLKHYRKLVDNINHYELPINVGVISP